MRISYEDAPPGSAWYEAEWSGVIVKERDKPKALKAPPEKLQDALDWAWQQFGDPSLTLAHSAQLSPSRRPSSRRTRGSTGA